MSLKSLLFFGRSTMYFQMAHGAKDSLSGSFTMNFQRNKLIDVNFWSHFGGFTGFVKEIKHDKLKLLKC